MIGHPAESMNARAEALDDLSDNAIEHCAIRLRCKQRLTMVSPQGHVVEATGNMYSGKARHPRTLTLRASNIATSQINGAEKRCAKKLALRICTNSIESSYPVSGTGGSTMATKGLATPLTIRSLLSLYTKTRESHTASEWISYPAEKGISRLLSHWDNCFDRPRGQNYARDNA